MRIIIIEISIVITTLTWFLETASSDDIKPEVKNLVTRYEFLMQHDCGYGKQQALQTTEELRYLSIKTLKNMISNQLTNIQCGYVYSSLHLLTLLKNLIHRKGLLFLVNAIQSNNNCPKENTLSILAEAFALLAAVYQFESRPTLNLMWLFYFYAESLEHYDKIYHDVRKHNNLSEINLLYNELNKFAEQSCPPENAYNNKFAKSVYYKDLIEISESSNQSNEIMNIIYRRKPDIHIRVTVDNFYRLELNNTIKKFRILHLTLNRVIEDLYFMKTLLYDFGKIENWIDVRKKLEMNYNKSCSENALVDRLTNLATFQQNFIKLLQILTLQLTWSRLVRMRKYLFDLKPSTTPGIKYFKNTSRKITAMLNMNRLVKDLTYFVDYLCLHNDIRFNKYVKQVQKINDITFERLNELINYTETTLNSLYAAFFNCTSTYQAENKQSSDSTLLSAHIYSRMATIDFNVIQSFIEFTEYLQKFKGSSSIMEDEKST